jgi:hypothetical protein
MAVATPGGRTDLVLLANSDAWPRAVLMAPDARTLSLPLRPQCGHTAALCRDYTRFAEHRLADGVSFHDVPDGYAVDVAPAPAERLLFVSATYRPEWQATAAGRSLDVQRVAGAFIGVVLPPGVSHVDLAFVPRARMALAALSAVTMCFLLLAVAVDAWRCRRPRARAIRV